MLRRSNVWLTVSGSVAVAERRTPGPSDALSSDRPRYALKPFVASLKVSLHRALVREPDLHGWTLNLYRSGEDYPNHVDDYFPLDFAPTEAMRSAMTTHLGDEGRHEAMFRGALASIDQPIVDYSGYDVFNECVRRYTKESFKISESDSADLRAYKLANFFCHAHFLEKRVAGSLSFHGEACELEGRKVAAGVIKRVLSDETRHVSLTADMARDLIPERLARDVFARHGAAEAQANVMFSKRQLKHCMSGFSRSGSLSRRLLCLPFAKILEVEARYA